MINQQLINPKSIVVIGASNNESKPGGKIVVNLQKSFKGKLYLVNPNQDVIQGLPVVSNISDLPYGIDLAVIALVAKDCVLAVKQLVRCIGVKAFIVISAGFSEEGEQGKALEEEMLSYVNEAGGCIIGPNCIGVITRTHASVFTLPIPPVCKTGADFISASGATAVFIMEAGMQLGLRFNNVFSVGNGVQNGVEDVLQYLDENFIPSESANVKLLYFESINNPKKLLKHASSLIAKGCRIAAIKAGSSEAGSKAASSHTGALANSDLAVNALFQKCGIIRCYGRLELAYVAGVLLSKKMTGNRFAIVTHAGGPAVMITDELSKKGFQIPEFKGEVIDVLKERLHPGSSVSNPIDLLATGNADQLSHILEICNNDLSEIDGIIVIFGSPGLSSVKDVYQVLSNYVHKGRKPVYAITPSPVNAKDEMVFFIANGNVCFPDEVMFAKALAQVQGVNPPSYPEAAEHQNIGDLNELIARYENGYLHPGDVKNFFTKACLPTVKEKEVTQKYQLLDVDKYISFPAVAKVVGPVHKTDVGGVVLNILSTIELDEVFDKLMKINGAKGVLLQPMVNGVELFLGTKYEDNFGHIIIFGLGGVFVEVLQDISYCLAPVSKNEALKMVQSIKGYKLLEGYRGSKGVNIEMIAETIMQFSLAIQVSSTIKEVDINPLILTENELIIVDSRIRIEK